MTVRLPLVAAHAKEHTYCAYCPKLCRHTCPVSTAQARETTTPWGKMSNLHHVALDQLPLDESNAALWYECTGCGRCQSNCRHDNDVASALGSGRIEAFKQGVAPEAAKRVVQKHAARTEELRARAEELFADASKTSDVVFAPGCTSTATEPKLARGGFDVIARMSGKAPRVAADRCCGLPLLNAGDLDGFLREATAYLARFDQARVVVMDDPGCLHTLKRVLPRIDARIKLPTLVHTSEYAAEHIKHVRSIGSEGPVRYHDPCKLGRGLGVYDAPRTLLTRMFGQVPSEMPHHHEDGECSGAGGQLPATDPETAKLIAAERKADHERMGGGLLVTACSASYRKFKAQMPEVAHLTQLLADAVDRA